ncbi:MULTISPECIES: HAD hydrolase-like protein [Arthrobacter]|uniref:HAD hydrolase-like protein n=2 Tax=Arthrobacter TaxID=1663 RepID=A0ABU9KKP1_9MICC|nr:HAD hydrolase-like protein [Arthrobacter sp. YJM1]MDP5226838.1 HAD hydrolase-like protein [Arthrobacter sp. YJM1]
MTFPNLTAVDVVCWDWNGTLLDDVEIARAAMNSVLSERGLPVLQDPVSYRRAFGFPIRDFYARLGIGEDDFRLAASRYLELFAAQVGVAALHAEARSTLSAVTALGVQQVLISATLERTLAEQMAPHDLTDHFAQVLGIADAYMPSKADVVHAWLKASGHDPGRVLMIGDTNHDEEIAQDLNVRFLRFAGGHQQPRDDAQGPMVHRLSDVLQHLRRLP